MYTHITNLLNKYTEFTSDLKQELFKNYIKIKENENLFLVYSAKTNTKSDLQLECNGLIFEKKTLKLICANQMYFIENSTTENIVSMEYCEDGTLLRLYNYNNEWFLATSKCIDAENSYWTSTLSFKQLFYELFLEKDLEKLNKTLTYLFVLKHIENVQVIKHAKNSITYIGNFDKSFKESDTLFKDNSNIQISEKITLEENFDDLEKFYKNTKRGILIKYSNNQIYKYDFKEFDFLKQIRGNTQHIRTRYIELLKDPPKLVILIDYYSSLYHFLFEMIRYSLNNVICDIYKTYVDTHIKHLYKINNEHCYIKIIKQLHSQYKISEKSIKLVDVYNKVALLNTIDITTLLEWA